VSVAVGGVGERGGTTRHSWIGLERVWERRVGRLLVLLGGREDVQPFLAELGSA
jgi:hypothetical protein